MNLELHKIEIRKLEWGPRTGVQGPCADRQQGGAGPASAGGPGPQKRGRGAGSPGESVRVLPCKDAVEPRCKLEGPGEVFPGWIGDVETVGQGKTLVLSGHGRADRRPAGGSAGRHCGHERSGRAVHALFQNLQCGPGLRARGEGVELHALEAAYRQGRDSKAAYYLAACCKDAGADAVESFAFPALA